MAGCSRGNQRLPGRSWSPSQCREAVETLRKTKPSATPLQCHITRADYSSNSTRHLVFTNEELHAKQSPTAERFGDLLSHILSPAPVLASALSQCCQHTSRGLVESFAAAAKTLCSRRQSAAHSISQCWAGCIGACMCPMGEQKEVPPRCRTVSNVISYSKSTKPSTIIRPAPALPPSCPYLQSVVSN